MHVENVDTYVQDVIHHVELMKKEYPGLPCILLGHSMASVCLCKMAMQLYKSMLRCECITKRYNTICTSYRCFPHSDLFPYVFREVSLQLIHQFRDKICS